MNKDRPTGSDEDFLARLAQVSDEVPVTEPEAEILLREAGIDAAGGVQRLLAKIESFELQQKQARFAQADAERRVALGHFPTASVRKPQSQ